MITDTFAQKTVQAQFCVVGGGMAGICAAVAAARRGVKTVLLQDRPVLGGNASSEIRMWICGAHGENKRETGILEEIQLENLRWNPAKVYEIWDHVLHHFVQRQKNLTLLLNCSCDAVSSEDGQIVSISAWQLTTQTRFQIVADLFADCSGDSVLRVSGAEFRSGREARAEFNESHAPEVADGKTMGNSILIQTRETTDPEPFVAPPWAHEFEAKKFHRAVNPRDNFWWMETGGEEDTIRDAETIRDELLRIAYGVWALMKENGSARNFDLAWIGALPGKRENIRYVGDYILTQNDVEKQGRFDDLIGYGGWSMDDHHPAAFYHSGAPTIFHPAPSPYGIPYRSLYSKNIGNLFFAGRNISATHMAMSSTRVMATCAILGQAVGTAASLAVEHGLSPREVGEQDIAELQARLMEDDCWLPWHSRTMSAATKKAKLTVNGAERPDADVLRDGHDRPVDGETHCFECEFGDEIVYRFSTPTLVNGVRIVFDSHLGSGQLGKMPCYRPLHGINADLPEELVKDFDLYLQTKSADAPWKEVLVEEDNFKRLVKIPLDSKIVAVKLVPLSSWGAEHARIYSFDLL